MSQSRKRPFHETEVTDESSQTRSTIKLNTFTWQIDNFEKAHEDYDVYSVYRTSTDNCPISWQLVLRPKDIIVEDDRDCHDLAFMLHFVTGLNIKPTVKAQIRITILGVAKEHGNILAKKTFKPIPTHDKILIKFKSALRDKQTLNSHILLNGALRLYCSIRYVELAAESNLADVTPSQLVVDYENLLTSGDFADIVFKIKDREIKVHKNILSARSCVFAAMLKADMKEAKESEVKVEDLSYETLLECFRFIYSGKFKVPNSYDDLKELFVAADKYQLDKLKSDCEQSLAFIIEAENAADCMVLASLHNAAHLKDFVIRFTVSNADKVVSSELWEPMFTAYPVFFLDVVKALAKVAKSDCGEPSFRIRK